MLQRLHNFIINSTVCQNLNSLLNSELLQQQPIKTVDTEFKLVAITSAY